VIQAYPTLHIGHDDGVVTVAIDAPPMNLIGPELVRDLAGLVSELESDPDGRVMVLGSADPEFFVPHVDLTKVADYTAEAAKAGGPEDASLGMLWRKLSELPLPAADAFRADAKRFQHFVASDTVKARMATLFGQGLQTRGDLELDLGDRIGRL
jgi:enoyl-CoA hydratase/carnithine racemase